MLAGLHAGASLILQRSMQWGCCVPSDPCTHVVCTRRYLQNITIPAAFVQKSVGDKLKRLIKPQKDLPHPKVLVSLDWTDLLPRNEVVSGSEHVSLCPSLLQSTERRSTCKLVSCFGPTKH